MTHVDIILSEMSHRLKPRGRTLRNSKDELSFVFEEGLGSSSLRPLGRAVCSKTHSKRELAKPALVVVGAKCGISETALQCRDNDWSAPEVGNAKVECVDVEVVMIKNVESLGTYLELHALSYRKGLACGEVEIPSPWRAESIPARHAGRKWAEVGDAVGERSACQRWVKRSGIRARQGENREIVCAWTCGNG